MQLTGILFGVLAAAWLLYLVPWFANSRGSLETVATEMDEPKPDLIVQPAYLEVSTPQLRQKLFADLQRLDRSAAKRRRIVLLFLVLVFAGVTTASVLDYLLWWVPAIPAALIVGFLGVARVTVSAMRRGFAQRVAALELANDEQTICLDLTNHLPNVSVDLAPPAMSAGSLWEPIPITKPTYVSAPIGPRTVRTIDLGGPGVGGPVPLSAPDDVEDAAVS